MIQSAPRPMMAASGVCLGLQRSNHRERQPPLFSASAAAPDVLPRQAAWEAGAWDATWMCLECAAGLYHHQPEWLADAPTADFTPTLDMGSVQVAQEAPSSSGVADPKPRGFRARKK